MGQHCVPAIAWGDKPRRSWEEAAEKFINEHLPTIKPGASLRYAVSMRHLNNHFAGKMLHQITSAEMSAFETLRRGAGVSNSTIRRDLACLSSLMTSAMEWEWTDTNPVLPFLKQRAKRGLKEGVARTRYLTEDEELKLLGAATSREAKGGKPTSVREAITLAIDTGLRREELFGLTWKQVDLRRGLIDTGTRLRTGALARCPSQPGRHKSWHSCRGPSTTAILS